MARSEEIRLYSKGMRSERIRLHQLPSKLTILAPIVR